MPDEKEPQVEGTPEEAQTPPAAVPVKDRTGKQWYVVRCQSGREEFAKDSLERRVKSLGLESKISDILVPTEKVTEIRSGKKQVRDKKKLPGYIMVCMEMSDDTWLAVRESPGMGDFLGLRDPVPMHEYEVQQMLTEQFASEEERPKIKIEFGKGDTVRVKQGPFENFEGIVEEINSQKGLVRVNVTVFGRATPVEIEYWQVEKV